MHYSNGNAGTATGISHELESFVYIAYLANLTNFKPRTRTRLYTANELLWTRPVSVAQWANTLSEPQYLLGLSGWRPAEARDQIRVAARVVGRLD